MLGICGLPLLALHAPIKAYFPHGIVPKLKLGWHDGFHHLDGDFIMGVYLPNFGCTLDFCLFDGHSSLGLILAHSNVGIACQLSSVGVQGGLGHEQPLQGHIHLPLQSRHLSRQISWIDPKGNSKTVDRGRCWSHPEFSTQHVGRVND